MLGLPPAISACLFDLDGVLTRTAEVHARAWQQMFEAVLKQPFDPVRDYDLYVDGKPREEGIRSFLASRHITLPESTIHAMGDQKDQIFLDMIHRDGVATYPGSVSYVHAAHDAGLKTAVVSSSKNTSEVLHAAGLDGLFDAQMDGNVAEQEHLQGKPHPDTYLKAAEMVGVTASQAAVFEDALAGVEAGHAGGFGIVVGVDRVGQADALAAHGADVVVKDLAELIAAP